jgi:hypothetical protein
VDRTDADDGSVTVDGRQTGWSDRRTHTPDPRHTTHQKQCALCWGQGRILNWGTREWFLCPRCIGVGIQLLEGEEP